MITGDEKKVNITLEIHQSEIVNFEKWLRNQLKVIDFKILPDTKELFQNDKNFQKICKEVSKAQKVKEKYINEHNFN